MEAIRAHVAALYALLDEQMSRLEFHFLVRWNCSDESRKTARDFRLSLESLIAQGKADGSVKAGAAEVWAGVWLGVVTHVIDRVSAKEWPETHAGIKLALDGAWDAIAAARP